MSCSSRLPLVALLTVSGWIADAAHGQPLQLSRTGLDPTFGYNGTVILNQRGEADIALSVAVQTDLRILFGGWSDVGPIRLGTIMRLRPDGAPDFGFGNGGLLTSDLIQGITAIAPLPDGKIVAAGLTWRNGEPGFGVTRIFGDGRPDPTFVGGGVTYLDLSPGTDQPHRIVAQPDGKC